MEIKVRNVHEALPIAVWMMKEHGVRTESRNGPVLKHPEPVFTTYTHPRERVLFWEERDANPFFHFYEALWMLAGRNDVAPLERFVKRMRQFANGEIFHGAYGHRWQNAFAMNQLYHIVEALRKDPYDRRQYLQHWHADLDLVDQGTKLDIPCNLGVIFQISDLGALDIFVPCRSNDIIWGCYGANAVHFSMLQEYMAARIGVPVGQYVQMSVNWHAYLDTFRKVEPLVIWAPHAQVHKIAPTVHKNPYENDVTPFKMVNGPIDLWHYDLKKFMDKGTTAMSYRDVFFSEVAVPLLATHETYMSYTGEKRYTYALTMADDIKATDWRKAVVEWIKRRYERWKKAQDDGVDYNQ